MINKGKKFEKKTWSKEVGGATPSTPPLNPSRQKQRGATSKHSSFDRSFCGFAISLLPPKGLAKLGNIVAKILPQTQMFPSLAV